MAYKFHAVNISVFDYHEMLAPLTAQGLTRPDFAFLVDEAAYNLAYKTGKLVNSAHFKVRPLRVQALNFHHFWKYYQTIWQAGGQPEFWKLQMPFVCKPTAARFGLDTGKPAVSGGVRAHVFLSALGWSNTLDISLRGEMTADELRDFVGSLLHQKVPVFRVSGQDAAGAQLQDALMTLPQVFRLLSEQLRGDVYQPNLVPTLPLKRFHIVTPLEFSGEEVRYYLSQRAGVKQMTDAGRRAMHSVLTGEPISLPELLAREAKQPGHTGFLLTRFNEEDFAITYFDYGTLLFMQQTSTLGFQPSRRKAMKCLSSNIRNYLVMVHTASWFYRDTESVADPKVVALRAYLKADLKQMPSKFINPFSLTFHSNYGPLKKL